MKEPYIKDLFRHVDDRGLLDMIYNNDLEFYIKRIYITINKKGVIRGMHGHKKEWKAFYVLSGSLKIVTLHMDTKEVKEFVLNDMKSQLFVLPPNYYHGYTSLVDESRVVILSDSTLAMTKEDDHRMKPDKKYFEVIDR